MFDKWKNSNKRYRNAKSFWWSYDFTEYSGDIGCLQTLDGNWRIAVGSDLWDECESMYQLTKSSFLIWSAKSGTIINMASIAGLIAGGGGIAYTSAKHAIVGFTKQLALDYAGQGIRVKGIAPGAIQHQWMRLIWRERWDGRVGGKWNTSQAMGTAGRSSWADVISCLSSSKLHTRNDHPNRRRMVVKITLCFSSFCMIKLKRNNGWW